MFEVDEEMEVGVVSPGAQFTIKNQRSGTDDEKARRFEVAQVQARCRVAHRGGMWMRFRHSKSWTWVDSNLRSLLLPQYDYLL